MLVGGVAVAVAVPEWPFRVFSFPSNIVIAPPAANSLLTIGMITRETLMILKNELTFTEAVSRNYDQEFRNAPKIGSVLNIRQPMRYAGGGLYV